MGPLKHIFSSATAQIADQHSALDPKVLPQAKCPFPLCPDYCSSFVYKPLDFSPKCVLQIGKNNMK